ncbi:unnamed protein product [Pleuronectes platessa]|uniref:Uncharacterized protein n=1 Tax=Pleuronectes platessa TaxID=8262 RepID=A0A9N7URL9_PLEPL|nr:unnamed protein product [Pleuronectes platessa]
MKGEERLEQRSQPVGGLSTCVSHQQQQQADDPSSSSYSSSSPAVTVALEAHRQQSQGDVYRASGPQGAGLRRYTGGMRGKPRRLFWIPREGEPPF